MINLILLTGFLGSGKTTLLTSILDKYKDKKIGVIINEFGDVNIDAVLIKRDGIDMAELSNGSIFCACLKKSFVKSLIEMSYKDIEYLFIEASGLADPSNMSQILHAIEHKVLNPYIYKGAISIIDSESFIKLYELLPALHRQVEYSNVTIINKADLVDENSIQNTLEIIHRIQPLMKVYITSYCKVDIEKIVSELNNFERPEKDTTNTLESRPKTFSIFSDECLSYEKLELLIKEISNSAYRIKGFAKTDCGFIEISAVGTNVILTPWKEEVRETKIVVISSEGIKILSVITNAIEKYFKGKIHF